MVTAKRILLFIAVVVQLGWDLSKLPRDCGMRRCWDLVPVVAAARDLSAGTVVHFDDLTQRSIPETMIRDRDLRPEFASHAVGLRLRYPISAGQPFSVTDFEAN